MTEPLSLENFLRVAGGYKTLEVNRQKIRYIKHGSGPLVVLVHGWPECWYTWKDLILPLAAEGYTVAVPDVRGYGGSDKPDDINAYDLVTLASDIAEFIKALGESHATVIGHDWGAVIAWTCALLHPDRVKAVAGLGVPYLPRGPMPPMQAAKQKYGDRFFYHLYFQEPGLAEAELEADLEKTFIRTLYCNSGDVDESKLQRNESSNQSTFLGRFIDPETLPSWLKQEDIDYYVGEYARGGFATTLHRYRNMDRDWHLLAHLDGKKIEQPAMFLIGARDPILKLIPGDNPLDLIRNFYQDLRISEIIPNIGHWLHRENFPVVFDHIRKFLAITAKS